MDSTNEDRPQRPRARLAATLTACLLAVAGFGAVGCGDDKEGPAEDAGKAIDDAGREGKQELDEAGREAGKELKNTDKD